MKLTTRFEPNNPNLQILEQEEEQIKVEKALREVEKLRRSFLGRVA